ncbi:sigma-70 family RNA polymerase sigma factor [Bacillus suaedaesalsae]|uniref:Sigma-70 family RNA polymerase sigma factor n=1 Tax=Bacillus suaedaesalsae TaxID=2810349 RepID=A0ABS2DHB0_9BACI|nr:sigma-70 family RNA polymerase sigma factor [Bacillus suaedaesalsae]MBM6617806.1 sigma-70 family RNA polymerase sigma factor [Bacillus suaedaesalsae]
METKELTFQEVLDTEEWLLHYCIKQLHIFKNKDEFYQVGLIGLWEAYKRFDPSRGVTFRTFAYRTVRGKMLTLLLKAKKYEDRQATLTDAMVELTEDPNPDFPLEIETILLYCEGLTETQKKWVILYFVEGRGQKEIASIEQVGQETVKSWRRYALQKIRKNIESMK